MQRKKTINAGQKKLNYKARKESKRLGKELRKNLRHQTEQKPTHTGRAKEIIKWHGNDPIVINMPGLFGPPAFKALGHGHLELADLLIQAPAFDPDVRDERGHNLLLYIMDSDTMCGHYMRKNPKLSSRIINHLLNHPRMNLLATTSKRERFQSRDSAALARYRGASALFMATTPIAFLQYLPYLPFLLEHTGEHANVYVEHRKRVNHSSQYVEETPISNLVHMLHQHPDIDREKIIGCRNKVIGLIKQIAELPAPDKKRRHPRDLALAAAVQHGDREVVQILLEAGADKTVTLENKPLVRWAKLSGKHELAELLESFGVSPSVFQPPQQAVVSSKGMFGQSAEGGVQASAPLPSAPPDENSNNAVPTPAAPPAAELEVDDVEQAKAQSMRM